ncbi:MAG: transglycosylase SLT domain-containing protein [Chitinivibrionales bacterium]|nr:transglycosylase SLT domain-containing protein [Chitinivibrionales bacterium]
MVRLSMHSGSTVLVVLAVAMTATAGLVASPVLALPPLDTDGTAALRAGAYEQAVAELEADSSVIDTPFHAFKLGLAHLHTGNYSRAMHYLGTTARSCTLLAPCAYEHIARAELAQERQQNALSAYRAALEHDIPQRYEVGLQNDITDLIIENDIDPTEFSWVTSWFRPPPMERDTGREESIRLYVDSARWRTLDSIVELALESRDDLSCEVLGLVPPDRLPDTLMATERLFEIADRLYSCGSYGAARSWLDQAEQRDDYPRQVSARERYYLDGMLSYRQRRYESAIKWLRKFEKDYGATPSVVITLARSYRGLGRQGKAAEWYDRHIKLFPRHSQTQEIMWYRAWQREERGQFSTAMQLYRRIRRQHRYGSRAAESFLREGLLFYRQEQYDSALETWTALMDSYPQSSAATAASYWRAKSLLALGRAAEAREAFTTVVDFDPISYYAYRARDALHELGDTTEYLQYDGVVDLEACRQWLDSIAPEQADPLTEQDSLAYRTGILLAVSGLPRHAEYYLEPILLSNAANLALQFELAAVYAMCGYPTLSYRAARPLAWRIPQEHRAAMPLGVHAMLYPNAFSELIVQNASVNEVEPTLVSAVIRQESIFDPQIVSPVGAIGLMQIMPTTGEEIARDLGERFVADSLYAAHVNIRYGSYYVKKLLDRFEGNIVLALAGYNGGPHNASRWYERNKDQEFDLFIENIGYTETRGYVKRVLSNYWTYNRLARLEGYARYASMRVR